MTTATTPTTPTTATHMQRQHQQRSAARIASLLGISITTVRLLTGIGGTDIGGYIHKGYATGYQRFHLLKRIERECDALGLRVAVETSSVAAPHWGQCAECTFIAAPATTYTLTLSQLTYVGSHWRPVVYEDTGYSSPTSIDLARLNGGIVRVSKQQRLDILTQLATSHSSKKVYMLLDKWIAIGIDVPAFVRRAYENRRVQPTLPSRNALSAPPYYLAARPNSLRTGKGKGTASPGDSTADEAKALMKENPNAITETAPQEEATSKEETAQSTTPTTSTT